jgi:hypothetical protein
MLLCSIRLSPEDANRIPIQEVSMAQTQGAPGGARPVPFTAVALRGLGHMADIQFSAARVMMQTQARAAASFGWPDVSGLFDGGGDERARHAFSAGAQQMIDTAQRASEAAAELQRQFGRVVEKQVAVAADTFQRGLEELGAQAEEGFNELVETARQTADEAEQTTESVAQATRETMRQATGAMRQQTDQAGEAARRANKAA